MRQTPEGQIFLLVDLHFFFRFRVRGGGGGGGGKKNKESSENDQLTGHFQSFLFSFSEGFFVVFLISPEQTVKLVK